MSFRTRATDALLLLGAGFGIAVLVGGAVVGRAWREQELPTWEEMVQRQNVGITLLDREGREFFSFDRPGRRSMVSLEQVPHTVREAVVAAEDKGFYHHAGLSPTGIARATYANVRAGSVTSGGSTLTQQVIKNTVLTPSRTWQRKFFEGVLALKLEWRYDKDDILELYLNSMYFGEGAYGIEEAARTYFGKSVGELTLAEASLLAGLLPAPSRYSPYVDGGARAQARQRYVLAQMEGAGFITADEEQAALAESLVFRAPASAPATQAPHFALMIRQLLAETYGEQQVIQAGVTVQTTLDLEWQQEAERQLQEQVAALARAGASNGAVVVLEPATGAVRALVGSRGWHTDRFGRVNMATAPRQTGSAFKPIVYAAGLQAGTLTPATILEDRPTTFGRDYRPENYSRRYWGRVPVRLALANSLNIAAVQALEKTGGQTVVSTAERLGITSLSEHAALHYSLALGAESVSLLELTGAYAALAHEGYYQEPRLIEAVTDKYGQEVAPPEQSRWQAVSQAAAYLVTSILSDEAARARTFGRSLSLGRPVAVKTGTTQDYRDALTVGYTPEVAVGVWIGNNDNRPMRQLPGALAAAPLWKGLMSYVLEDVPASADAAPPSPLVAVRVCRSGLRARPDTPGYTEYFVPGTEPTRYCPSPTPELEGSADDADEKTKPKPAAEPRLAAEGRLGDDGPPAGIGGGEVLLE